MKRIYLDLESTVIKDWENPFLINVDIIRQLINRMNIKEIGVFSYAIWDERDIDTFNATIKPDLEASLGVTVVDCPPRAEVASIIRKSRKILESDNEVSLLFGKKIGFEEFLLDRPEITEAWLIDDMVPNLTSYNLDRKVAITFIGIDTEIGRNTLRGIHE